MRPHLDQQQQQQNSQCYWTGIWPNCQSRCQWSDIVTLDFDRPLGGLCQTGRLRYCCASRWNGGENHRHHHRDDWDGGNNRRPGQWHDDDNWTAGSDQRPGQWQGDNGPLDGPLFGLDLNIG